MTAAIRVGVVGAGGRLGSAIVAAVSAEPRLDLVACVERSGSEFIGREVPGAAPTQSFLETLPPGVGVRVLIEASSPESVVASAETARREGAALLVAVTGLSSRAETALAAAAQTVPVLVAPNLSLGAVLLLRLTRQVARLLPEAHLEIVETHHAAKRDSPSGTALWLAREAAAARGVSPDTVLFEGGPRQGPREGAQIAIHSLRAGTSPGEHRVRFGTTGESLELVHSAESRAAFAAGAVRAAEWLASAAPGRYNMEDILADR